MTNAEVIKLVKAGFKEKTVILIIASRIPNFDLTSDRMIQLKRAGVSENIIVAMLARQEGTDIPTDDGRRGVTIRSSIRSSIRKATGAVKVLVRQVARISWFEQWIETK